MNIRDVLYMRNTGKLRPRASIQDKLLAQKLSGGDVITTATGNPVSIATNKAQNAISTLLSYSPKQSGTGDPSPQNIRPIEGWTEANLFGCGKNLFMAENPTSGYIRASDGTKQNSSTWKCDTSYSPIKGGTSYTVANITRSSSVAGCAWYDEEKNYVGGYIYGGSVTRIINVPENVRYFRASWSADADNPVMLIPSETDVPTTYEPYTQGANLTANLGGTYYGFSVDVERGVLRGTHQKLVFDGTEDDWGTALSGRLISRANVFSKNLIPNAKCNMYLKGTNGATTSHIYNDNPDFSFCTRTTEGYQTNLYIKDSRFENDLDGFKAWIAEHNLEFVEELATPIEIPLTPQTVALLKGNNTLWCDGDSLNVTYKAKK